MQVVATRNSDAQWNQPGQMPLSVVQEGLWFLQQLDPASTAYHLARAYHLRGPLDVTALERALSAVRVRQAVLRTRFGQRDGRPCQSIEAADGFGLAIDDLSMLAGEAREAALAGRLAHESEQPFDLSGGGHAARFRLFVLGNDWHVLSVALHHIISDGASTAIFEDELARAYRTALSGAAADVSAPSWSYLDFSTWQREQLAGGKARADLAYWIGRIGKPEPGEDLPADFTQSPAAAKYARTHAFGFSAATLDAVRACCRAERCTPFVVLLAAWQVVLHRYSGRDDFCIGVPTSGRFHEETEQLMGLFVDTHVYRAQLAPAMTGRALLQRLRGDTRAALDHADITLSMLVDALGVPRDAHHQPLFQTLFNVQRTSPASGLRLEGLQIEAVDRENETPKFDLSLDVRVGADKVCCVARYDGSLYRQETIATLGCRYEAVLVALCSRLDVPIADIPFVDEAETIALSGWNGRAGNYADVEPVHRSFERNAAADPDAVALLSGSDVLTYGELDARANRLAHRLARHGVGPEVLVGISIERSIEMVIGLLAILKAGGAYLPLDPDYPMERLSYMIADSGIRLLLTRRAMRERLSLGDDTVTVLELDTLDLSAESASRLDVRLQPESLAYVIYTSGSTGRPKGAANRHGALFNRLAWMQNAYQLNTADTVLQKTPFSFDVSVWEFFWPLMVGARLAIAAPGDHKDPAALLGLIERHQVTTLHFVPAMLQAFISFIEVRPEGCAGLRRVICSGEALPAALADRTLRRLPQAHLCNLYGPTEAAIDVTHWTCRAGDAIVPIGRPIANLTTHVLDLSMNRVPPGVAGELYLGGAGLARGYLNKPGLSAERFVPDPFDGGARLYRTGDLARWREDGVLEYLGRTDYQVKMRGFRIELGEIEAQLHALDDVAQAVVLARDGFSGKRLVAYIVVHPGRSPEVGQLAAQLHETLPDYMVPSAWVVLEQFPLSPNGKVDRNGLPDPENVHRAYEAPQPGAEEALAGIWQHLLKVSRVGRHDNFFELGGDSILSLQIVERVRQAGWKITARQLFERQTISQLAAIAVPLKKRGVTASDIPSDTPLLPMQAWFFEQIIGHRNHWNQAVLLSSQEMLDIGALARAIRELLLQHEVLRSTFKQDEEGRWYQQMLSADEVPDDVLWVRRAAERHDIETLCDEVQRSLDLTNGPLLRAMAIEVDEDGWRLLIVIHHLVVDGVSWRILLADLRRAYEQCRVGAEVMWEPRTDTDRAWAARLAAYAAGEAAQAKLAYWQNIGEAPTALPCDMPEGRNLVGQLQQAVLRLDREQTRRLLQETPIAYRTQVNDVLLTALGRALCAWTGQTCIRIDLEGHGREDLFDDIDIGRTVGWFTSLYPVTLDPRGEIDLALKRVKEALRNIPERGVGFGALKYMGKEVTRRGLSTMEPSQVVFNYLGQLDQTFDAQSAWPLAAESPGRSQDEHAPLPYELSINGRVHEGSLSLTISYSGERYRRQTIDRLADRLRMELAGLIEHCTSGAGGATPSDFDLAGLSQKELDRLPLVLQDVEDLYPLSPTQSGILFHALYAPDGRAYVNQLHADLDGLDVERFIAAWQAATVRHEILRTGFVAYDAQWLQWVAKAVKLPVTQFDWRGRANCDAELDALADMELDRGFDLGQPPLQRLTLVRTGASRCHFIWTYHHVLMDGWSVAQLMAEVLRSHMGATLPTYTGRYRDYIEWLRRCDTKGGEAWWRGQLAGLEQPTQIAGALGLRMGAQKGYARHVQELDMEATARIVEFARQQHVTVNTIVQAAWSLLLQRYTGQRTVVFGATVTSRPAELPGSQHLVGLFINTLPVVTSPRGDLQLGAWLQALQAQSVASVEHAHTPLYDIQRWAGVGGTGLFDSIVVFENYPVDEALRNALPGGLRIGNLRSQEETNYAFTLAVTLNQTLKLGCRFKREAFPGEEAVAEIAQRLSRLLVGFIGAENRALGELKLIDEEERTWLLNRASHGAELEVDRQTHAMVHVLIERQARLQPEAVAVVCGEQALSYGELNARANRLAWRLRRAGVGPEVCVGIAVERSVEMVAGLLGILKAGGAYVPLDPSYPGERLSYMIADSGIGVLLTQSHLRGVLPLAGGVELIELDTLDVSGEPEVNLDVPVEGENLAYVIYTSGSTGRPKGTMICHRALGNFLHGVGQRPGMSCDDTLVAVTSLSFDISALELYLPLMSGARVVIASRTVARDGSALAALLRSSNATVFQSTPSTWQMLLEARWTGNRPVGLLKGLCGGEALSAELATRLRESGVALWNMYGPTETTIWSAVGQVADGKAPTLGLPVSSTALYVMDASLNLVPRGVSGELYIGGAGLARGYLGRAGLTAERFVPDPFGEAGGRLYRTGDLARWNREGELEYLGRIDHQVKVRGFRIELGEIEARLLSQAGVREAAVVAQEGPGGVRLAGYVTARGDCALDGVRLREALSGALPDYMVPGVIVVLEALPLNANGKVDRRALPQAEYVSRGYEAPQGEVEEVLSRVWGEVLGVERVGRHDNFFELGGDSISAMKVQRRASGQLSFEVELAAVFVAPDLRELARMIQAGRDEIADNSGRLAGEIQSLLSEFTP